MAHDRVDGDELFLTHEFLSIMLGVRRAGGTTALNELDTQGLVLAARGRVTASDDSDYVVGTTLFVDGGMTLYPGFGTNG